MASAVRLGVEMGQHSGKECYLILCTRNAKKSRNCWNQY